MNGFRPPFSIEAFLDVFARYNTAIWPLQIVAYLLGMVAIVGAVRAFRSSDRVVSGVLAVMWVWVGAVYHLMYFSAINPVAQVFGVLFIVQGALLLLLGVFRSQLRFAPRPNSYGIIGGLFILYAMVIYPLLGYLFGHVYPHAPMFGVTPCPLLVFTFGLLLFTTRRVPAYLLIIPALWSIIGLSAATALGVPQDFALLLSAVVTISMLTLRNRRLRKEATLVAGVG